MSLYRTVADLSFTLETVAHRQHRADTTSGFERATTEFVLSGAGETGRGEDVTYAISAHDRLAEPDDDTDSHERLDVPAGEYSFDEFSGLLADADLFPAGQPPDPLARNHRRWGLESAGLDLALCQAGQSLSERLDRPPEPVRFVVSTRLGEPPTIDRVERLLEIDPTLEFKLDPTTAWPEALFERLRATDAVRVLDLKGWYQHAEAAVEADPELYRDVFAAFPTGVVEDPAMTPETQPLVAPQANRLSFDYPVTSVDDLRSLPVTPGWCNIKPSRFGSVRSLFETIEYCQDREISCYGGGQFELGPGRAQIQTLAALFYPDGPNDVAPRAFNDPEYSGTYPTSPLAAPTGFGR